MKAALVIMAAGMGSRYGGSKQVDGIGPDGEILMEYSIYDAIRAGFTKVVFIIKPEMRELVETLCGRRVAGMTAADRSPVEVCYAYQDFSSVPAFYSIPTERTKPFGTTHADYFYGPVPCTRELTPGEIDEDYEKNTGKVIIEELTKRNINPVHVPGIICASHGPFTWGKDAAQAVYHAVVLEEVAFMNFHAKLLNPAAGPMPQVLLDKHYLRKHGANAYYGQG